MIVVAIIAVIAAIAIPSLLRSRLTSNETSAQATLRTIVSAQSMMKRDGWVDADADGIGEYATLGQLAGVEAVDDQGLMVNRSYLTTPLGWTGPGMTYPVKAGYHFRVDLPDTPDLREHQYVAYAWPQERAKTGNKCFVVTSEGMVHYTLGTVAPYSGQGEAVPARRAAFVDNEVNPTDWMGRLAVAAQDEAGTDGNAWYPSGQ